jgi:hypothetical protein
MTQQKKQPHEQIKKGTMTRRKQLIVTAIGISVCSGILLHLTRFHGQTAASSPQTAASGVGPTAFPGNTTPEDALRTLGWAAAKGDFELLRDGVTPDIQEKVHAAAGPNAAGHAMSMATQLAGARILKKETLSDDQVLLYVQPEGKNGPCRIQMQRVGNSWKLAGLEL